MSTVRHVIFVLLGAFAAAGAVAQVALPTISPPPVQPAPASYPDLPEYRAKALPTDTFKSSEQISEDNAVAFPADI